MKIIKNILQAQVQIFFKIYFGIFGTPKLNPSMKKTLDLYNTGDFSQVFQLIRAWDAPYEQIDKVIPQSGFIVDLGCGDGLLANYIAISRPKTKVFGVDINRDRLKEAKKGVSNATFLLGDIISKKIPKADIILIIHVLHHLLSHKDQEKLLMECKSKLKKNGKLIIAEVAEKPLGKYIFSWLTDHFTVPILFENRLYNPEVFFRRISEWQHLFKNLGLQARVIDAHKSKPFSHVIYVCQKT